MRVAELLRGSCDSFSRAAKRSSAGFVRSPVIAFSFLRLAAYCATIFLRLLFLLTELCFAIQSSKGRRRPPPLRSKREVEAAQERARLVVVPRRGAHDHVEAPDLIDLVVVDLGEHDVLPQANGE